MQYKATDHNDNAYRKSLGKITKANFGAGGYQDAQLGLSVDMDLEGGSSGCGAFVSGGWGYSIEPDEHSKWKEADREKSMADMCRTISLILSEAKVDDVHALIGKPVEVALDSTMLHSWIILTEVL